MFVVTEQRCGTCKWLRVTPDKDGRRVVRKANAYLCTFEPMWPPLPDHIWYMEPMQGTECPVWTEFKK